MKTRRRNDKMRMKRKARKIYNHASFPDKYADHLAVCSCWMCGNPRKFFNEKTRQEKKAELE